MMSRKRMPFVGKSGISRMYWTRFTSLFVVVPALPEGLRVMFRSRVVIQLRMWPPLSMFPPPHGTPALECGEEGESPKGDSPKPRALARGAGFTISGTEKGPAGMADP